MCLVHADLIKHCCEDMERHLSNMCEKHDNPFDCPDYVIHYSTKIMYTVSLSMMEEHRFT